MDRKYRFVGILSQPFPHTSPWNERFVFNRPLHSPADRDECVMQKEAWWDQVYMNSARVNGAIPLCHLGCGLYQWLVVTGPEAGHVWEDERVDGCGLRPAERPGLERVTFLQWFGFWLEKEGAKFR
jgi:hypothetical protein